MNARSIYYSITADLRLFPWSWRALAKQTVRRQTTAILHQVDLLQGHDRCQVSHVTCTSAASAWGSQSCISMARYNAMAMDSSARACSRRPILV